MSASIVTLIDLSTQCGEGVYTYDNDAIAMTKLRRSVRDAYLNGEVNNDWINSHSFAVVGTFNFGPYFDVYGDFENEQHYYGPAVVGFDESEWVVWSCRSFVDDIYKDGDEDDNS